MALVLTIDQGGHASRAIVFDELGEVVARAERAIDTVRTGHDRVEHDPEALVASVREAVDDVAAQLGGRTSEIETAGLATQRSSIVCWDRTSGRALSPVLSWQDRRAAEWLEQYRPHEAFVRETTGLVLSAHYGASKLRWCLDHVPAVRGATTMRAAHSRVGLAFGPIASFLLFRLLDERPHVIDPANASRTLLWDYRQRDWSRELLDLFGVAGELLPACVASRHDFGHLRAGSRRVPLMVTTGDQSAALFACGEPGPRDASVNIGTGAFVQRPAGGHPVAVPGLLSSIVWQDAAGATYVLEGTVNGAASAIEHMRASLGLGPADPASLAAALRDVAEPPLFLNGVSGLGSPWWRPSFPSRLIGPGGAADARQATAAVLESIVFLISVNLEAMAAALGAADRILVSGGLSSLDGLCQRLADVNSATVVRPRLVEATSLGLARLLDPSIPGPADVDTFEPGPQGAALRARFERWREAMAAALAEG